MKEKSGRRSFIKNAGIGGIGAALLPVAATLPVSNANASGRQVDNKDQEESGSKKMNGLIILLIKANT